MTTRRAVCGKEQNHKRNPYTKVVYQNLIKLVENETEQGMIDKLAKLNYKMTAPIYRTLFVRASMSTTRFIKLMLASGQDTFTITITDEDKKMLLDYEDEVRNNSEK